MKIKTLKIVSLVALKKCGLPFAISYHGKSATHRREQKDPTVPEKVGRETGESDWAS